MSKREVIRVRKIQAAEVTIATEAEVTDLDRARPRITDQRGPDQKTVAIELHAAAIVVVMKAALNRVALAHEVLAKDVGDVDVLMACVEAVQAAVRILLEHREVSGVELHAIVVGGAEHARTEVVVGEDEAAEVRDKWLYAGAHRDEIVIRINIEKLHFAKRFFKRGVPVSATRSAAHVDVDDTVLACVQIIGHAEGGRKL